MRGQKFSKKICWGGSQKFDFRGRGLLWGVNYFRGKRTLEENEQNA